jgi:uncharacterized protein
VKLSDGEKLILTMLSDIYEHLGIEGFDPKLIRDAINDGQAWAIKWKYRGIFDIDETESDVHHDTVDILGMWDLIERAYGNLNSADKQRIETEAAPFGKNVEFMGFDGRDETDHLSVARFLIDRMGKFDKFKGRELDSHMPGSLASYKRMYKVFDGARGSGELTAEQIIEILNAARRPA